MNTEPEEVFDETTEIPGHGVVPDGLDRSIDAALDWIPARQYEENYWNGRLDMNACMEAGWLLAQGRELSRGFMINYNLYRHYFSMMALARARQIIAGDGRKR